MPSQDQERSEEPMYVIVEFRPERYRRQIRGFRPQVYDGRPDDSLEDILDRASGLQDSARHYGRHDDRYEVYQLVEPSDREAAYRAGREDAARDIEDAMDAARGIIRRGALRAAVRLARGQHPRTPGEDVTP